MKKMLALVMAACMALSLAACGGNTSTPAGSTPAGDSTPASGSTTGASGVTVQIGPNPETIDPALNSAIDGANMLITFFEPLLIVDENNTVQPGQAEKYEVSEDGLTWTFTLRDGLKWSDGTDITAEDFVYTFQRVADVNTAAPYAATAVGMIKGFDDAQGNPDAEGKPTTEPDATKLAVSAPDAKTFVVELSYPCTYFDKLAAFATLSPVQKATVDANGDSWATAPESYVCNGPYMIDEWTVGEKIVAKKNPNYKGGWDTSKIVSDTITFLLIEDSTASYTAYQSGQAQLVKDVPTEEIPSLTKVEDGGDFYVDPIMGTYYLSMQTQKEPFNDANVRKALSLAIDRDFVANTLMQGTYSPAYTLTGPGITDADGKSAYMDKSNTEYLPADYETSKKMAQEALAAAGYPNGEGFPAITYSTNDAGYHKVVAEYLQQCYQEVLGITLNVEVVEWGSFTPLRRAGDYEMSRNGWIFDYNDPSSMLELFMTGNGNNDGKYSNATYDQLMKDTQIADVEKRFENLHKAEDAAMADYAMIPVAYYNDFWLQSPTLKGSWHSPYGYWYLQYAYVEG